jgi:penicillin-binding protein 1C
MKRPPRWIERPLVALGALVAAASLAAAMTPLPPELREAHARAHDAVRVLDREGRLIREVRADDETRAVYASRAELGDLSMRALVAAEDRRYFGHSGVDPIAVARAAVSDVTRGRIVSGASTITMQLARLVRPHHRDLLGKACEALLALRIETSLDKERILTEYANRAPFGPGIRGLRAASLHYFDREPTALSVGEAALLASLPNGPAAYDPVRHPARAMARRARVLVRLAWLGLPAAGAQRLAAAEPTTVLHVRRAAVGAHFVTALLAGRIDGRAPPRAGGVVRSTLDAELQADAEHVIASSVRALTERHVSAGAAIVLDNQTGDVLAYVGSPDPYDRSRGGYNDGVRARRQAGSTLKPFLYGLAFERGEIDAASMLADVPLTVPLPGGAFVPGNYDGRFHGPVRARVALASSLNVPAVALAERVGVGELLTTLRSAGFQLDEAPEHYGAALVLGDGEVTLLELARAYAALARGGETVRIRASDAMPPPGPAPSPSDARLFSRKTAWILADILADKRARLPAFGERNVLELPFRASVKTGTSKGFRDNWAMGFTDRVTAGVWVGNFDGSSMRGVSGVDGAGPALRALLIAAESRATAPTSGAREVAADAPAPELGYEEVAVCPLSGDAPGDACPDVVHEWLPRARARGRRTCTMHVHALVERSTGRLASPRCDPRLVERRVFESMPPELATWARAAGRSLLPLETSAACGPAVARAPGDVTDLGALDSAPLAEGAVRIEHPAARARYYLEPGRPASLQAIGVRVRAPRRAASIALRVDGREVSRGRPGDTLAWTPAPGHHALVAEAAGQASEPVYVDVE